MFLWLSLAGTQRTALQTDPTLSLLADFYICLVFGLSLAVCAWAFYRISGGLFNPAVSAHHTPNPDILVGFQTDHGRNLGDDWYAGLGRPALRTGPVHLPSSDPGWHDSSSACLVHVSWSHLGYKHRLDPGHFDRSGFVHRSIYDCSSRLHYPYACR